MKRLESGNCESCGVEKLEVFETNVIYNKPSKMLCSLCRETHIGNAAFWPDQYRYVTPQMLAEAVHWLLKELKK